MHQNVLEYLRNSLADADKLQLYPSTSNKYKCTYQQIIDNKLPSALVRTIKNDIIEIIKRETRLKSQRQKNKTDTDKDKEEEIIPKQQKILIFPLIYKTRKAHNYDRSANPSVIFPLSIPATLDLETGILTGDRDLMPYIPRSFLSPQVEQRTSDPSIAELSKHDDFLSKNQREPDESITWNQQLETTRNLWHLLTDHELDKLTIEGYERQDDGSVILLQTTQNATIHIMRLYDELIKLNQLDDTPLLKRFLNPEPLETIHIKKSHKCLLAHPKNIAQMQSGRSLSRTQKDVLNHIFDNPDESIHVINGPPGTGKTTLLQSIIANQWVQAAVDKKMPPIVVASSSNNNAVLNVINSFHSQSNTNNKDTFYKRWIPNVGSFGLYCASPAKLSQENLKPHWIVNEPGQDVSSIQTDMTKVCLESISFLDKAQQHFRKAFQKWSHADLNDLDDISEYLHSELTEAISELERGTILQRYFIDCKPVSKNEVETIKVDLLKWTELKESLQCELSQQTFWQTFLLNINSSKAQDQFISDFQSNHSALKDKTFNRLTDLKKFLDKTLEQTRQDYDQKKQAYDTHSLKKEEWKNWSRLHNIDSEPKFLDKALDHNSLRHKIFYLATHYWESRWLQDMRLIHQKRQNKEFCKKELLQVRAQLTPCFISTFHMLPTFFNTHKAYLNNSIDYLIIDEAGQVSTAVAAPSFALAKKTIIVGDIKQLEAINFIAEPIDRGNCEKHKVIKKDSEYKTFLKSGLAAIQGTVMHRGHALCNFKVQENIGERGFFLKEHWRCVPEIATYCNEIAYAGALEPMRFSKEGSAFPPLGFSHIKGNSHKQNGSLYNEREAQVIIKWLEDNRGQIESEYPGLSLEDIVGVITPYRAQVTTLQNCCHKSNLAKSLTIGTVHTFQGIERSIIIFSPCYSEGDSTFFINNSANFLNVAVSRAKDHFFVFGDINVLSQSSGSCLENLMQRLLMSQDNELKGIDLNLTSHIIPDAKVENLHSLQDHQNFLVSCLESAQKRILIHSPFLSANALYHSNLINTIEQCVKRKVNITVVTDENFNSRNQQNLELAKQAENLLIKAGVNMRYFFNDHSKSLFLDDHTYTAGSFNWLSASRNNKFATNEHSIICSNSDQIPKFIHSIWSSLNNTTTPKRKLNNDESEDMDICA